MKWPKSLQFLTFRKNTCIAFEKEIQQKLDEVKDSTHSTKAINVKVIKIEWLLQSENQFLDLPPILNQTDNESIVATEFVLKVRDEFWDEQF